MQDVPNWNTNDHGVNNAEGALRWPAVTYRMTGRSEDAAQMPFALSMLDKYQGQVAALFCADEVFCGKAPHRGTETCAVVEAMTSLAHAFEVLGTLDLVLYVHTSFQEPHCHVLHPNPRCSLCRTISSTHERFDFFASADGSR
eukprot:SAG31_NODE_801_length_12013_cov_23.812070_12_plen_143_part_00